MGRADDLKIRDADGPEVRTAERPPQKEENVLRVEDYGALCCKCSILRGS